MKTKNTFNVLFIIRRRTAKKNGKYAVICRVTRNGQRVELNTRVLVTEPEWKEYQSDSRKAQSRHLRTQLLEFEARIHKIYKELLVQGSEVNLDELKNQILGKKNSITILEAAEEFHQLKRSELGKSMKAVSVNKYRTTRQHLADFIRSSYKTNDLSIQSLDYSFFTRFQQYLLTKANNGNNGMVGHLRRLKRVANHAVACGFLSNLSYEGFKTKVLETKPVFLEMEELIKIQEKKFEIQRLEDIKNLFLFSCYTGMAFIDVQSLTANHLVTGIDGKRWIVTRRTKTDTEVNIPILRQAQDILDMYHKRYMKVGQSQLLPKISNQKMNAYLKEIADICGVAKRLTTHVARFTFATTICAGNGVPIDTAQKLLGHKRLLTTQHHYRTSRERIATDMNELERKLSQQKENSQNNQYNSGQENRAI